MTDQADSEATSSLCDQVGALRIAERIRLNIPQGPFTWKPHATVVMVRIGAVTHSIRAEQFMYYAPRKGLAPVELSHEANVSKNEPI
ncbi:MAG: hypothetical protein NTX84_03620 [Nitrospirae bacterium]|nr:hypothetical protein [Nitrospirota bacterium]